MTKASLQNTTHPQSEAFLSLFPKPDHKAPSECDLERCLRDIWDKSLKETPFSFSGLSAKSPGFDPLQAQMGGNDYSCKLYAQFKTVDRTDGEIAIFLGPVPYPAENGEFVLKGNRYIFPIYLRTINQYRKLKKRLLGVRAAAKDTSDDFSEGESEHLSKDDERKTDNLHIVLLSELLMPYLTRRFYKVIGKLQKNEWKDDLQALRMWLRGWFRSGKDTLLHKILYRYGQLVDQVSPLNRIFQRKELSFYGLGGEHPDSTRAFHLRDVDDDDLYRICPVVTPQGHKVGMRLFLARQAKIDVLQNAIIGPEQPEPGDSLSDSASLIPFIEHDDVSRALMGANMMKQAMILTNPDNAWIQTGWEEELARHPEIPDAVKKNGVLSLGKNLLTAYAPWGLETFEDGIVISQSAASALSSVVEKTFWFDQKDKFYEGGDFCVVQLTKPKKQITAGEQTSLTDQEIVTLGSQVNPGDVLVHAIFKRFKDVNKTKSLDVYIFDNDIETLLGKQPDEVRDFSLRLPHNFKGRVTEIIDLSKKSFVALPAGIKRRIGVKIRCEQKVYLGDKISSRHGAKGVVVNIISDKDMPFVKTQTQHCNEDGCKIKEPHRHVQVILNPLGVTGRLNLGQLYETTLAKVAEINNTPIIVQPFANDWDIDRLAKTLAANNFSEDGKEQLYVAEDGAEKPLRFKSLVGPQYFMRLIHLADGKIQARAAGKPYDYTYRDNQPRSGKRVRGSEIIGSGQRIGEMETWALAGHAAWHILDDLMNVKSDDRRLLKKVNDPNFDWNGSRRPQGFANLILLLRAMCIDLQLLQSNVDVTDDFLQNKDGVVFDKVSTTIATSEKLKKWGCAGTIRSIDLYAQKKEDQQSPLDKFYPDPEGLYSRTIFDPTKPWQMGLIELEEPIDHPIMKKSKRPHDFKIEYLPVLPIFFRMERLVHQNYFQNELNKLYRSVLVQNDRLKKLSEAEEKNSDLVTGAKQGLQKAIEKLFLGEKGFGRKAGTLKSILAGKKGLLRGHLAGKRTNFSGRSVIIGDPALRLNEVGLPSYIWEKFFPEKEINSNPLVILNRQPSLHRNSVQSFRATKHNRGEVIRLNPYVCKPFNADFDGDTITIHVPCKPDAIREAEKLLPVNNLLSQANGKMVLGFDKDIALAAAYLTYNTQIATDEYVPLTTEDTLSLSARNFWEKICHDGIETTVGRLLLRRQFDVVPIKNKTMSISAWNEALTNLTHVAVNGDLFIIENFTHNLSRLLNHILKQSGLSLSLKDFEIDKEQGKTEFPSMLGLMRQIDKYGDDLKGQITERRGNMRRPGKAEAWTEPIDSNLLGGHTEKEYFMSAHGARAGLVDKGLITAHSGHLLRDWIYLLQHIYIVQEDCGVSRGLKVDIFKEEQHQILQNRYGLNGSIISEFVDGLEFRSPLRCLAKDQNGHPGICKKCYGIDPSTGKLPEIGLPVGILAAQALGERISQETLKSFHSGGTKQEGKKGLELVEHVRSAFKNDTEDAAMVSKNLYGIMQNFSSSTCPKSIHFEVVLKGHQIKKDVTGFLSKLCHSQSESILRDMATNTNLDHIYEVVTQIVTGRLTK